MNMNKPPDETLKQGRNRSWLLVKFAPFDYWITTVSAFSRESVCDCFYIYKEESLFVCLFVLYAFGHRATKCDQTFQESSSHPGGGQQLLFSQNDAVLCLQQGHLSIWPIILQHSVVSKNYWAALFEQAQDMYPGVFEGAELESAVHSPRNLIG